MDAMAMIEMGPLMLALALMLDAAVQRPGWRAAGAPPPLRAAATPPAPTEALIGWTICLAAVLGVAALGWAVQSLPLLGAVAAIGILALLIPQRALIARSETTAAALERDLALGRRALARQVGLPAAESAALEDAGAPQIARRGIELAAERFARDVATPAFWFLTLGLAGAAAAAAARFAARRIGPESRRPHPIGAAAAQVERALAWGPARLAGLLIACAAPAPRRALRALMQPDPAGGAWRHPLAAMAGALDAALAPPPAPGREAAERPRLFQPQGRRGLEPRDLRRANRVVARAWILLVTLLLLAVCGGVALELVAKL